MHLLTIPSGISEPIPVAGGTPMEAGETYICSNAFTGALLASNWRVMINDEMWALRSLLQACKFADERFDPNENWSDRHIWLMRGGGWGDLLTMTPLIRALKKKWPECKIHVAMGKQHFGIFHGLGVIEESLPIKKSDVGDGIVISFEDWIEGHPGAEEEHIAQHFAGKLGINLEGDHQPSYTITDDEEEWREVTFTKTVKKRIGIQVTASALYRTYPFTEAVIGLLLEYDLEVILFGHVGQLQTPDPIPEGLINATDPIYNCSFRRSAALLKSCDCLIAPDSALVHLASALEVPYVGLYGPMPADLRCSGKRERSMGKGITGQAECSPCFFHAQRADEFPAGMPCQKKGYCVALAEISPEQIVETALKMASPIADLPLRISSKIVLP